LIYVWLKLVSFKAAIRRTRLIMQRLQLSKLVGTGVLLAGFAVLPLAVPSAARSEDMRGMGHYEMGRHVAPEAARMDINSSYRPMMLSSSDNSTMGMGKMMLGNQDTYFRGISNYELGRHVLPEAMRMDSEQMMMMRHQSMQPSSMMQQNMPGSTMQPSSTMETPSGTMQTPSGTMQPSGTMDMPSGTMQPSTTK
jgi:hypothetical protein